MLRRSLTDETWARLAPFLPPMVGPKGGHPRRRDRETLEGILWRLRTGSPWRDVPAEFGKWNTIFVQFETWTKAGTLATILEALASEADLEWVMGDATIVRAHQHAAGAKKGGSGRSAGAGAA